MQLPNSIPKIPTPLPAAKGAPSMPPIPPMPPTPLTPPAPPAPPKAPSATLTPPMPNAAVKLNPVTPLPTAGAIPTLLKPNTNNGPTIPMPGVSQEAQAKAKLEVLKKNVADIQNSKETETDNDAAEPVAEANQEQEVKAAAEETPQKSDKEAEKEPKTTRSRKNKAPTSPKVDMKDDPGMKQEDEEEDYITIKLKPTCKDFDTIEEKVFGTFNDPKWEELKEEVIEMNAKIIIESDMSIGSLKTAIANLSALRNKILILYLKYQTNFQNLVSDKPEGIIERVKRLSSKGSNENERKRNGILACMQYEMGGEIIDLFELLEQTRERYNFFKGIMEAIEQKQKALITMNSAIIMEQKLEQ